MNVKTRPYHRWMALFLCVVMCVSLLPTGFAFAEEGEEFGDVPPEEVVLAEVEEEEDVEEPVVEEPVVEEPVVEEPVVEEPVVEEPVVEEPVVEEPVVEEPVVEEPVVEEPVVEEPVVEGPAAEEPVVEEPVVEEPVVEEPVVEEPVVEEPVVEEPVVEEPAVEEPVVEEPAVEEPIAEEPAIEEPVAEEPAAEEPAVEPVWVIFKTEPEDAEITVYTKNGENQKQVVDPEQDGSYLLVPGNYFYDAIAENYIAVEEKEFEVKASEQPFEIEVTLEEEVITEEIGAVKAKEEANMVLDTPVVTLKKNGNGILVQWNPVTSAARYRVYRKVGTGSYAVLTNTDDATTVSITDYNLENDTDYSYRVVCLNTAGTAFTSAGSAEVTLHFYINDTPVLEKPEIVNGGVKLSWSWTANNYRIYRQPEGGSWALIKTTSEGSYTDEQVVSGKTYSYCVRGCNDDTVVTAYSKTKTVTYYGYTSIKALANKVGSVKVTWNAVGGVDHYRLQRRANDGAWKTINSSLTGTSYDDADVASATRYTYRLIGLSAANKIIGTYDSDGKSISFYDAPELLQDDVTLRENGIEIFWTPVKGVSVYRVYRKTGTGNFAKVADVSNANSYYDTKVAAGVEYTYTARCLNSTGTSYLSAYRAGVKAAWTRIPVLVSAAPAATGIKVTWDQVSDVTAYRLYRKLTTSSAWSTVADVAAPSGSTAKVSYTDTYPTTVQGTKFDYTVRCIDAMGGNPISSYDKTGVRAGYYPAPTLKSVTSVPDGIDITWDPVVGVSRYRVYRRIYGGAWSTAGTVAGTTTFTDSGSKLTSGVQYYYSVVCLDADKEVASVKSGTYSATFYGPPTLNGIKPVSTGIQITWTAVGDATKYRIYRKTTNTTWQKLIDVDSPTAGEVQSTYIWTDTSVVSGNRYYYSVSCMVGGNEVSKYNVVGLTHLYYEAPKLSAPTLVSNGIVVKWNVVDRAPKYRVLRKEANTAWKNIGETTETSFKDTKVVNGGKYTYTVLVISSDGKNALSAYNTTGKTKQFYHSPTISKVVMEGKVPTGKAGSVKITWSEVEGISYYNIYRKIASSSWTCIKKGATGTSYADTTLTASNSNKTVQYIVICVTNSAGSTRCSANSNVKAITFLAAPTLVNPSVKTGSITVKWKAVNGAAGYMIYRKVAGGSWKLMKTSESNTTLVWKDETTIAGQVYYYTVRAYNGNIVGGYDSYGKKVTGA